jgi:hypothetical protein
METVHDLFKAPFIYVLEVTSDAPQILIIVAIIAAIGILGQWVLYYKADLPGVASVVPVWNVFVFMDLVGRPRWHSIFVMLPPPVIAFLVITGNTTMIANIVFGVMLLIFAVFAVMVYVELCKSFGNRTILDYILVIVFNGLYVMYLGMGDNTQYFGPAYGKSNEELDKMIEAQKED